MITRQFNNYIRYQGKWYSFRPFRSIYPITLEIKKLFHLYINNSLKLKINNKSYWLEEAILCKDGNIYETFPLKYFDNRDEKFNEELKKIIFYRYILGFQSNEGSIRVGYNGERYFPISYKEGKTYDQPKTGKIFKVTPTRSLPGDSIIRINPTLQLKILFKTPSLKYESILNLVEKIRKIILKYDSNLYGMILDIQDRLTEHTQFK